MKKVYRVSHIWSRPLKRVIHVRGNTVLVGIAMITLLNGLASEGFDRLYGAHFIQLPSVKRFDILVWPILRRSFFT